jgi:hypothetical protein
MYKVAPIPTFIGGSIYIMRMSSTPTSLLHKLEVGIITQYHHSIIIIYIEFRYLLRYAAKGAAASIFLPTKRTHNVQFLYCMYVVVFIVTQKYVVSIVWFGNRCALSANAISVKIRFPTWQLAIIRG